MIDTRHGLFIPTCDICGAELPREFDFYAAVDAKKEAGWRSKKTKDDWEDICTECQKGANNGRHNN